MKIAIVRFSAALALVVAGRSTAEACSSEACGGLRALPIEGAGIPANATTLRVWGMPQVMGGFGDGGVSDGGDGGAPLTDIMVTLSRRTPSGLLPVTIGGLRAAAGYRDVPIAESLIAGETYQLTARSPCLFGPQMLQHTFTAQPGAPMPTTLGTLMVNGPTMGTAPTPTSRGSCADETPAHGARLSVEHSAEATPWRSLFVYTTLVDGVEWRPRTSIRPDGSTGTTPLPPGGSSFGRGVDYVYTLCAPGEGGFTGGATPGRHRVRMRAQLPGSMTVLETNEVEFVLQCAASTDAGTPDVATGVDAATGVDVTTGADTGVAGPSAPRGGCSVGGSGTGSGLALSAWVTGGVLAMSRRRARRRSR